MLILTFKTDDQIAEIGVYDDQEQRVLQSWQAYRELSNTIHTKIVDALSEAGHNLHELEGIVVFKGPGSFTGLRIGLSTANALAYSLDIPIASGMGEGWVVDGIDLLMHGSNERLVVPEYGAAPNITKPKH